MSTKKTSSRRSGKIVQHKDGRIGIVYNDEPLHNGRAVVIWTVKRGILDSGFGTHRSLVNPDKLDVIGMAD